MPVNKWNPEKIQSAAMKVMEKKMAQAVQYVVRQVKTSLNVSNRSGEHPSRPGEPPHKVSGDLYRSITGQVIRQGANEVVGAVGSNVKYARRLELGFHGVDSAGHRVSQEARPYLRPGIVKNRAMLKKLLGVK